MANRVRDPQREQFWREVLTQFHSSGLSVRGFCRQERIPEPRFYAWRRVIAERDGQSAVGGPTPQRSTVRKRSPRRRSTPPAFVPVVMWPGPLLAPRSGMSLELRGGRVLHLPESMPAERLAALVHALEATEAGP